jgi:hypothetical protein
VMLAKFLWSSGHLGSTRANRYNPNPRPIMLSASVFNLISNCSTNPVENVNVMHMSVNKGQWRVSSCSHYLFKFASNPIVMTDFPHLFVIGWVIQCQNKMDIVSSIGNPNTQCLLLLC